LSLIRSKLFWKIAGLYVLLSVPAIVGLVAALQTRLYADAVALHEQQLQAVLRESAKRLCDAEDAGSAGEEVLRIRAGLTGGRRVWLSDDRGFDPPVGCSRNLVMRFWRPC
jgi:hypothetical protein